MDARHLFLRQAPLIIVEHGQEACDRLHLVDFSGAFVSLGLSVPDEQLRDETPSTGLKALQEEGAQRSKEFMLHLQLLIHLNRLFHVKQLVLWLLYWRLLKYIDQL